MEQDETLKLIEKLREEIERLKNMLEVQLRRNFGPEPPSEDDIKCEICGSWSDVSPCDLCCQEGYVQLDEDGCVCYGAAGGIVTLKKFEKEVK